MCSQKIKLSIYVTLTLLSIILGIAPNNSLGASCLWYLPRMYYYQCEPDCPTKYPDSDTALDVITQDSWLYHSTHSGTCVYHNGTFGMPSSYQISYQTCENRPYSNLPSQCTRHIVFYYADGAFCSSATFETVVWSCEEEQKQYIIKLEPSNGASESETILTSIEPDKSTNLVATVYDQNNQLVPNVGVRLTLKAKENSGGHHHSNDTLPARTGTMQGQQVLTGDTGPSGQGFSFAYNAPDVSGDIDIMATCTGGKNCQLQGPDTVWVGVKGLVLIPAIPNGLPFATYQLFESDGQPVGRTDSHPDNHYLTPEAIFKLWNLGFRYSQVEFPSSPLLHINDASLIRGGLFDIDADWDTPHEEHREGTVIDIRANGTATAIPQANFKIFEKVLGKAKMTYIFEGDHYHVRLLGIKQ